MRSFSIPKFYLGVNVKSIPTGYLLAGNQCQNKEMNRYEIRRLALLNLIESFGRGGRAKIASELNIEPSYVSRCCYEEGKKGKKNIGDEMVEKLNTKYPHWINSLNVKVISKEAETGKNAPKNIVSYAFKEYKKSVDKLSANQKLALEELIQYFVDASPAHQLKLVDLAKDFSESDSKLHEIMRRREMPQGTLFIEDTKNDSKKIRDSSTEK